MKLPIVSNIIKKLVSQKEGEYVYGDGVMIGNMATADYVLTVDGSGAIQENSQFWLDGKNNVKIGGKDVEVSDCEDCVFIGCNNIRVKGNPIASGITLIGSKDVEIIGTPQGTFITNPI